ncbi:MAG: hypothetical protein ACOCTU_07125, partial [Bacteroidota bacterium]
MENPSQGSIWYYPKISQGFGIVLIFLILSFLTGLLISAGNFAKNKILTDLMQLFAYLLAAGGTLLIITQVKTRIYFNKPTFTNLRVTPADYVIILILTVLVIILIDPLTNMFPVPEEFHELFETMFSRTIPAFITVVILAPVLEELM